MIISTIYIMGPNFYQFILVQIGIKPWIQLWNQILGQWIDTVYSDHKTSILKFSTVA